MKDKVYLCAISNIESGTCNEDCKFCTQSVKYKADIVRYKRKTIEQIVEEAKMARANKAIGFCLVTAGKGLDDDRLAYVCEAARAVKALDLGLKIIIKIVHDFCPSYFSLGDFIKFLFNSCSTTL